MTIRFTVLGEPGAKGRPRFYTNNGHVKTYTPEKTVSYENLVKLTYQAKYGDYKFSDDAMLTMLIKAYFTIPKSVSKKKRELMLSGKIRPIKKPDWDNVGKIIADSLNKIPYKDDAQIVSASLEKYYSDRPRVEVFIGEIKNE